MTSYVKIILSSAILWMAFWVSPLQGAKITVHPDRMYEVIKEKIEECKGLFDVEPYYLVAVGRKNKLVTTLGFTEEEVTEFFEEKILPFYKTGRITLYPEELSGMFSYRKGVYNCVLYAEEILAMTLLSRSMKDGDRETGHNDHSDRGI